MPPRKFAPTPIEQTTKSSRQPAKEDPPKPPRRFAAEPVEQSVKSSKDARPSPSEQNEVKPKPRRFAPEPVETTTKSSKDVKQQESDKSKPRRFAPQVVEESHKTSKDKKEPEKKPHVKFTPEPIATTYGSNRKSKKSDDTMSDVTSNADEEEKTPPRKFTPILLDTATRSRRAGNPNAILSPSDRTEYGYHAHEHEHWRRVNGVLTPSKGSDAGVSNETSDSDETASSTIEHSSELRRQVSPLDGSPGARPSCLMPTRQHSFRMPELDTIESSESEPDSSPSSLSDSPSIGSPITASDSMFDFYKHATRRRESIDESFTHYLLEVERKKAQQRLEEQALAAFPNADFGYEPPRHYFNDDDDSDEMEIEDRPVTFDFDEDLVEMARRESTAKISWEQQELQRHAEQAQQERNAAKSTAKKTSQSPWWHQPNSMVATATDVDQELKSMRDRARPPMLGKDLVFPRCPSPEPARFDVTQGSAALRNQMCYLAEVAQAEKKRSGEDCRLWQAKQPENKRISTVKSPKPQQSPKTSTVKGLWGGFCINDGETNTTALAPPAGPTGLMTPKPEIANPFEVAAAEGRPVGVMTPGAPGTLKQADLGHINAILVTEREIDIMMETEYPDTFITQVYNYLSLGYPSLARPFDEELAKISKIPISELRQDDRKAKATPRGYIRLGSDFEGGGGEGVTEDGCMRWQALKRYVREWAKQEKNMVKTDGVEGNWGTGARRGSWAI